MKAEDPKRLRPSACLRVSAAQRCLTNSPSNSRSDKVQSQAVHKNVLPARMAETCSDQRPHPAGHDISFVEDKVVDHPVVQRRIPETLPGLHGVLPDEIDADIDRDETVYLYKQSVHPSVTMCKLCTYHDHGRDRIDTIPKVSEPARTAAATTTPTSAVPSASFRKVSLPHPSRASRRERSSGQTIEW